MTTKKQIENLLKEAMRSGDDVRKSTYRMALSAIKLAEVEKVAELNDSEMNAVLQKEVKSRRETIADAEQAEREDIIQAAMAEIAILVELLPEPMSMEELESMAKDAIEETGATSIREMGQVMKVLMPRTQGRATGEQTSQVVRKLLQ
jgi:uncharacterized protein YqeY